MLMARLVVVGLSSAGIMALNVSVVSGQDYPTKVIRITTGTPAGGLDFAARLMAPVLAESMGQQVIVDNRVAMIAANTVAGAPPDGYTLLFQGSPLWLAPLIGKVTFDPLRDFAPITAATQFPSILLLHPSVPAKSVKDLIDLPKTRPGELNYASGVNGASNHIAGELFNAMAGIKIERIIYKGTPLALNDLIGGRVELFFSNAVGVMPHVKAGKLRALAVTSAERSALIPDLPTVAASGLPGYESISIYGMFAPAGTAAAIIGRLHQELVRALNKPDVKAKLFDSGVEVVGSTPERLAASIKSEMAVFARLMKDANFKAE